MERGSRLGGDASERVEALCEGGHRACNAAESAALISQFLHLPASRDGRLQVALCLSQGLGLTLISK